MTTAFTAPSDRDDAHLSQHHDDAVGVQEAGAVPLVQSHLGLHRGPRAPGELLILRRLRAGHLREAETRETSTLAFSYGPTLASFSYIHIQYIALQSSTGALR